MYIDEDPSIPPVDIKHRRSSAKITVYSRTSLIDSSGRKIKPIKYVVNRHLGLDDGDGLAQRNDNKTGALLFTFIFNFENRARVYDCVRVSFSSSESAIKLFSRFPSSVNQNENPTTPRKRRPKANRSAQFIDRTAFDEVASKPLRPEMTAMRKPEIVAVVRCLFVLRYRYIRILRRNEIERNPKSILHGCTPPPSPVIEPPSESFARNVRCIKLWIIFEMTLESN